MHHAFLDIYSDLKSPIHSLDARLKTAAGFLICVIVVSCPPISIIPVLMFFIITLILWKIAKLPYTFLFKRLTYIIPFVLIMFLPLLFIRESSGILNGSRLILFIILRASTAIAILSLITSTTPFPLFLNSLKFFKIPSIIVSLISFMYSFIYIFIDELHKLGIGRKSREFRKNFLISWKAGSWMLGTFFLRTIERSERVYTAMLARGYDGTLKLRDNFSGVNLYDFIYTLTAIVMFLWVRFLI